jgi:hypothetical protein
MSKKWTGALLGAFALFIACDHTPEEEYFSVGPDERDCASPVCGGFWFKRVNQDTTRCLDGNLADRCYAADLDFTALNLGAEELASYARARALAGRLIVKGKFVAGGWASLPELANFKATEAWAAASDQAPTGTYLLARQEPIDCTLRYPCPNITGTKLNTSSNPTALYAGLDLSGSGASETRLADARQRLAAEGLVVAAKVTGIEGTAGWGPPLIASQFYIKLTRKPVSRCIKSGCSGQVCSDQNVITTCEWREEYACYRTALCEVQPSGACGWTQTEELKACLSGAL